MYVTSVIRLLRYEPFTSDAITTRLLRVLARLNVSYKVSAPMKSAICQRDCARGGIVRTECSCAQFDQVAFDGGGRSKMT